MPGRLARADLQVFTQDGLHSSGLNGGLTLPLTLQPRARLKYLPASSTHLSPVSPDRPSHTLHLPRLGESVRTINSLDRLQLNRRLRSISQAASVSPIHTYSLKLRCSSGNRGQLGTSDTPDRKSLRREILLSISVTWDANSFRHHAQTPKHHVCIAHHRFPDTRPL